MFVKWRLGTGLARGEWPANESDPMQLYSLAHRRTLLALKREYGMGLTQVLAITMKEARSACLFGDADSLQGVSMCAAFALGVLLWK